MLVSRELVPPLGGLDHEIKNNAGSTLLGDSGAVVHLDLPLLIPSELVAQGNALETDAGVELVETDAHLPQQGVVQLADNPVDLVDGRLEITPAVGVVEQAVALTVDDRLTRNRLSLGGRLVGDLLLLRTEALLDG